MSDAERRNAVYFEGGASRSEAKPAYRLINPQFTRLIGEAMTVGMITKGEFNYRSGGSQFIKGCYDHALDHLHGLIESSDPAEVAEHIGHAAANLNMLVYFLYRDGHLNALHENAIPEQPEPIDPTAPIHVPVAPPPIPDPEPPAPKTLLDKLRDRLGELPDALNPPT